MQIGKQSDGAAAIPWAHLRIPPFPQIAIRVLQLTNNEDVPIRQLSNLISSDASFASELLTIANSALYYRRTPVSSILQAIALIGQNSLKGICLTVGVRTYLGKSMNHPFLRAIWRHSLACALIAEQLAQAAAMNKENAYTAGVLHDIGRLALVVMRPEVYAALLATHSGSSASLLKCERDSFGFDHCEAGRHLVADWRLPAELEAIVSDHHAPRLKEDHWNLAALISVSCRMADTIGFAVSPGCSVTPYADLLSELPDRVITRFSPDPEVLAFGVSSKINAVELG